MRFQLSTLLLLTGIMPVWLWLQFSTSITTALWVFSLTAIVAPSVTLALAVYARGKLRTFAVGATTPLVLYFITSAHGSTTDSLSLFTNRHPLMQQIAEGYLYMILAAAIAGSAAMWIQNAVQPHPADV